LVVEDCWHGFGMGDGWRDVTTYFDIEALLKGDAWKELTYITPCTDFIASGYDHRRKRLAQPETWDALIKERDGDEFGAEVKMFIVPDEQERAKGEGRTEDGRAMQHWAARPGHEIVENWRLATPEQELKGEVRIIATRGKRSRVVQLGFREKRTWKDMKAKAGGFAAPEGMSSLSILKLDNHQREAFELRTDMQAEWVPYHNDMADAVGWIYGGWGRRMELAMAALSS